MIYSLLQDASDVGKGTFLANKVIYICSLDVKEHVKNLYQDQKEDPSL